MSKAEDRALEKYPIEMYKELGWSCVDKNAYKRQYFIEGYHQAEKDVAEAFARIIRGNLSMMDRRLQYKFEQLYTDVIGEKMYKGFID